MQHIVASAVEVTGPARFDGVLPRPKRRPAFFGDGQLPPELEKAKNEFYRDVVVLAFPTPAGGGSDRRHRREGALCPGALFVAAGREAVPARRRRTIPPCPPGAAVDPAAHRRPLRTSRRRTAGWRGTCPQGSGRSCASAGPAPGPNTRPAPVPGSGLECDKLDQAALDAHFEPSSAALLREIGPHKTAAGAGWTMLHIDSWEMGAQNWTGAFREEFRRRRGYDPLPYLPAITGRVVEAWRSRSASSGTCARRPRSWSSRTTPSISRSSAAGTGSGCPSSPTT